jgi:hypothetical protein
MYVFQSSYDVPLIPNFSSNYSVYNPNKKDTIDNQGPCETMNSTTLSETANTILFFKPGRHIIQQCIYRCLILFCVDFKFLQDIFFSFT